jgi:hypothetical protein
VNITDRDGVSEQLGLPKLVELMKGISLSVTPGQVPADLQLEFTFSSPMASIIAAVRSWAEKDSARITSSRVPWHEDFSARRRVIQAMPEADAEVFRQQILTMLKELVSKRTSAIALGSDPEGLPIVITSPEGLIVPFNRNRTTAILGCLQAGTELEGYVTWADGRRVEFKQRASRPPLRFIVGGKASAKRPPAAAVKEKPIEEDAPATSKPPLQPETPSSSHHLRWWMVGLVTLVTVAALLLWLRRLRK